MPTPQLPPSSPQLENALHRRNLLVQSQYSGKIAALHLTVALISLYDANHQVLLGLITSHPAHLASTLTYLVEMVLFAFLVTTSLTSLWNYLFPLHGLPPIPLTAAQYRLLRLHPSSPGFTLSPEKKNVTSHPNPFTPLSGSIVQHSPSSTPSSPINLSMTPINMSNTSWMSNSPGQAANTSSTNQRRDHYDYSDFPLTDEQQLATYLSSYHDWENSHLSNQSVDDSGSQASQSVLFWRPTGSQTNRLDFTSPTVKPVYQLSSPPPASTGVSGEGGTNKETASDQTKAEVLSHRLGIDPLDLVSWNQNLRVWMTQTILRPLVSEIDSVNTSLTKHGVSDCLVGQVAVDRLRKVATLPHVVQGVPSLAFILPYLEVSTDQVYLIERLRQLAKTGALSVYKWNGGGSGWSDRLPTDSEVLIHCLASYMDSRLITSTSMRMSGPANPQTEARPFTGVNFYKYGEKPENIKQADTAGVQSNGKTSEMKDVLAIVQTGRSPVHYVVQVGGKQLDVGGGRNNLIHSILLFLHKVKQEGHGMLGRVNLGLSGLNILWVLD